MHFNQESGECSHLYIANDARQLQWWRRELSAISRQQPGTAFFLAES